MKQIFILAIIACALFFSCSKKSTPEPQQLTIGGTVYPTIKIGTQTWTSVNYNGAGGENLYNSTTNDPLYGKFYTLAEANAITLPSGWRLPTKADVTNLLSYMGATGSTPVGIHGDSTVSIKLESTSVWSKKGNNSSGFNAYPAGINAAIGDVGTDFWINGTDSYGQQYVMAIMETGSGDNWAELETVTGINFCSIRFVKDN